MTTLIPASCHCGRNKFQIPFKTSTLPKVSGICHCNMCRHSTGNMSFADVPMDGEPLAAESTEDNLVPADLSNLTEYRSSSMASRLFCSTCFAHMFFRSSKPEAEGSPFTWCLHWGLLENFDGIVILKKHIFVADTLDGGIADHFRTFADEPMPRYKEWDEKPEEELPVGWQVAGGYKNPETLPLYCQCRSINLYLTRASKLSDDPAEFWLVPGKEPNDPIRFIAAHCLCNSCRQCSGGQIQTWAIVPNENVYDAATKAPVNLVDADKRPKGLKQYISSEGNHRESCGTCGATVFWWRKMKEGESPHLDISVGLIDQNAAGGARAESWIAWYNRVMNDEFALSKQTAKALSDGLAAAVGPAEESG